MRKWGTLFITTSHLSLVFFNSSSLPIALPTLQQLFSFTPLGVIWVLTSYLLVLSSLLLVTGKCIEIVGYRRLLVSAFSLFALGSLLGGFSMTKGMLLFSRVLQGMGGAIGMPASASLLISTFSDRERAKAVGINTSISSFFLIIGAPLGGFLLNYFSWRFLFWMNLPLALVGLISTLCILPKGEKIKSFSEIHWGEALSFILAIAFFVTSLMQGPFWGILSYKLHLTLLLSLLFFASFLTFSIKKGNSLLPFTLFKNRAFSSSITILALTQMVGMITVLWAIYFQKALHYTAAQAGMMMFITTVPVLVCAPLGGFIADRFGAKIPILTGFSLIALSLLWMMYITLTFQNHLWAVGLFFFGVGMPSIFSPAFAHGLSAVPQPNLGSASSLIILFRQLLSLIGISIMSLLFQLVFDFSLSYPFAILSVLIFGFVIALVGFVTALFGLQ